MEPYRTRRRDTPENERPVFQQTLRTRADFNQCTGSAYSLFSAHIPTRRPDTASKAAPCNIIARHSQPRTTVLAITIFFGFILLINGASADPYIVSVIPATQSCYIGNTLEYHIVLDNATSGLAGYDMTVSLSNPGIAEISGVTYPAWALFHVDPPVPAGSVSVGAVDIGNQVVYGDTGIPLVTIAVHGVAAGTTPIAVTVTGMDDDHGYSIQPSAVNGGDVEIMVVPPPVAGFTANTSFGTLPLAVAFTDTTTGPVTSWSWDFDNNGVVDSTAQNTSYTFPVAGNYTVNMTVTGPGGTDSEVKPDYIIVAYPPPVAGFAVNATFGTEPLTVAFTDQSTNGPTSWAWDFEADGIIDSTDQNPVFSYLSAGTYSVELAVSNEGGTDDLTKTNLITVLPAGSHTVSVIPRNQSYRIGETREFQVVMNSAPIGLAGYTMTVDLATPGIARITGVTFPSWAGMHSSTSVPAQSVTLYAVDTGRQVSAGAVDVLLVTLAIEGDGGGVTPITVTVTYMDADNGFRIQPSAVNGGNVIITMVIPLPGYSNPPTDPDGDGLYEDLNGNGRKDFNDLQLYYAYMSWIEQNEPLAYFDYNSNGRIDFNDLQLLYTDI